uniref:Cyclin J n=1 Tax=Hydractinia echinata TaxID=3283270 RepID=Q52UM8_HYDEC|nr:cyclin J [Hydractinia echinata]
MVDHPLCFLDKHEDKLSAKFMLYCEKGNLQTLKYTGTSTQLFLRRYLVDWLAVISEKLQLTHGILHLSVTLLDLIMDKFDFPKQMQLNLLALCSLWVAAKLDEGDDLIPRVATLRGFLVNSQYFHEDFVQMELTIMTSLDWRLLILTPVQFLDFFLKDAISEQDLHVGYKIAAVDRAKTYIRKYAFYFMGVVIQDPHFFMNIAHRQSHWRECCAHHAHVLKISPYWPLPMAEVTGYTEDDLKSCVNKLMKYHEADQGRCQQSST